jgi:hypothetical protein
MKKNPYGGWRQAAVCVLLGFVALGCLESVKKAKPGNAKVDSDSVIRNLALTEQETEYGFYEFIGSSDPTGSSQNSRVCRGKLLLHESGAFKFEQDVGDPSRSFWAHAEPEGEIVVAFPLLQTVYKASWATLFQDPEAYQVLAAFDGLRILLGLNDVWSNLSANNVKTQADGASFQQNQRPYKWKVEFSGDTTAAPFTRLKALQGWKNLVLIERKTGSIKQYDRDSTDAFLKGRTDRGQSIAVVVWETSMEGSALPFQVQFTAYPKTAMSPEAATQNLKAPDVGSEMQIKELTLPRLKQWLNLR